MIFDLDKINFRYSKVIYFKLKLLDSVIITLVILNLIIYFMIHFHKIHKPNNDFPKNWMSTPLHLPPKRSELTYSEAELNESIIGLNLPTWSRSYIPCNKPGSEITCSEVIHAWRTLNSWNNFNEEVPFKNRKILLMQHLYDGVGNRFSTDTVAFMVALMLNRSFVLDGIYPVPNGYKKGQAFKFNPHVYIRIGDVNQTISQYEAAIIPVRILDTFHNWYYYVYDQLDFFQVLKIDILLYATMIYANHDLALFSRNNFGLHAGYFVCNFLMTIPEEALNEAKRTISTIPNHIRLFGIHLRFHNDESFFCHTIIQTLSSVLPFLKYQQNIQPTVFAFASDSNEMERSFLHYFPKSVKTSALRKADADHDSALYDIALLEMCNECLLTYRSTFSYICAMRMGKRAWFVDKESPGVFQASNSQATAISALYHDWDVNDWQLNRRFHITVKNEEDLRYYFKYLLL